MIDTTTTIENHIRIANESIAAYENEINERRYEIARIQSYITGLLDAVKLMQRDD